MNKLKHLLAGALALCIGGTALAQASGQTSTGKKSRDPFVERREEMAEAKKKYNAGEISKEQYDKARVEATEKLKATGQRGIFEQNLEVSGAWNSNQ